MHEPVPGILPKSPLPRPPGSQPQRHPRPPVVPSCAVCTLRTGPVQPLSVWVNSRAGRDRFLITAKCISAFLPRDVWLTVRSQELRKAEVFTSVFVLQTARVGSVSSHV